MSSVPEMTWLAKKESASEPAGLGPSPADSVYREAEAAADRRVALYKHLVIFGAVMLFFLGTAGLDAAVPIGLIWGVFLAVKAYNTIWAPELKRKWTRAELEQLEREVAAERREVVGRHAKDLADLSASIAHEIRNPITAAKSLVQQMGEDPSSAENLEYARVALEELDRVERSISHLLRYAREEPMKLERVDLNAVAKSAAEALAERIEKHGIQLALEPGEPVTLEGDPEQLRRVVLNLAGNAIEALATSGTPSPKISISVGQNLAGDEAWLEVEDNGPGIPAEEQQKMWSPFHTTKAEGTGLGLAITKRIVEAHRGSIEVSTAPGSGAKFTVTLPRPGGTR